MGKNYPEISSVLGDLCLHVVQSGLRCPGDTVTLNFSVLQGLLMPDEASRLRLYHHRVYVCRSSQPTSRPHDKRLQLLPDFEGAYYRIAEIWFSLLFRKSASRRCPGFSANIQGVLGLNSTSRWLRIQRLVCRWERVSGLR